MSYWQLRPLVRCLCEDAAKILIQALINTWLDYCNSLYFGIADGLMSRLQSVQNAAAPLITGVRRCEHITPALRQLHWLPVHRRVDFKISTLVYRSLADTAPDRYLIEIWYASRFPSSQTNAVTKNEPGNRFPTLWPPS